VPQATTWQDLQAMFVSPPPPAVDRTEVFQARQRGQPIPPHDLRWSHEPIFSDGSCKDVQDPAVARASTALVQPHEDGTMSCLTAVVPAHLPQTAVMAEHWAISLLAGTLAEGQQVVLMTDCQALVTGIEAGSAQVFSHRTKFGGFWEVAQQVVAQCYKVPAHLTEAQAVNRGIPRAHWAGNYEADILAGQALAPVDEVQLEAYLQSRKTRGQVIRQVADKIGARDAKDHPAARLRAIRPGYATKKAHGLGRVPKVRPHQWELHRGQGLLCTACHMVARKADKQLRRKACPGRPVLASAIHASHTLAVTEVAKGPGEAPLFFCIHCYGYSQQKVAGKLRLPCQGRPHCLTTIGSRLQRHKHPVSNVPLLKPRLWTPLHEVAPGQSSHIQVGPEDPGFSQGVSDPAASFDGFGTPT
jgi:hypothetical protein